MEGLSARDVADLLAEHCERLFSELVPDAHIVSGELRGHGPDGAVWTMRTRGHKRGVWANWAAPELQRGDCLELVHHARFPGEAGRRQSFLWSLNWLGLGGTAPDPDQWRQARERAAAAHAERAAAAATEAQKAAKRSRAKYLAGDQYRPEIVSYLRDGRGLTHLKLDAKCFRVLRFADAVPYADGESLPAMLAPIINPISRQWQAVHCTYLEFRDGAWRNITREPRKKYFGPKRGGVIPLHRGASRRRYPPPGDWLLLGEGIENSLAAGLCCPEADGIADEPRIWAAGDLGNFSALELPSQCANVILVHDQDDERFGNLRRTLTQAWINEGRQVWDFPPPRGFKDFNDYVRRLERGDV